MGKGSSPRPFQVPRESYEAQFEAIFGKKCKKCGESYTPNQFHKCKEPNQPLPSQAE